MAKSPYIPLGLNRCSRCKIIKPLSDFRNQGGKNRHLPRCYCRKCEYEYRKEWRINNPDRKSAAFKRWRQNRRIDAFNAYGGAFCKCCGETEFHFLTIDHINNDGAEHRRKIKRNSIYEWLKKEGYPNGFQVLCFNCNLGKAHNKGICPHKTKEGLNGSRCKPVQQTNNITNIRILES